MAKTSKDPPSGADVQTSVKPSQPRQEIRRTPAEWAERLGLIQKADPRLPQQHTVAHWTHAAASELFGWERHAYHYQADRFEVTEEQYRTALKAASIYPCCELPLDAIPSSQRDRFRNFAPRASRKGRN